jgi:HK97 family phage portal protein
MGGLKFGKRIAAAATAFRKFEEYDEKKWNEWQRGLPTAAGTRINETSSLTISALFAAVNFLASTFASLPVSVYRRLPDGSKIQDYEHPLYDRLHNKPNDSDLTSWQWRYTSIYHKYLWGNWHTYHDTRSYRDQELIPLLPDRTWVDPQNDQQYITHLKNGQKIPRRVYLPRSRVLHIPHISLDGIHGKGIIHYARESLGLAKGQEQFAATFFGNGIHPGGFVEVEGSMEEETRKGLQKDFNEKYGGLGKTWKFIFLSGGAKAKEAEVDPQKAQALESRQFSVVEIARWMNLPPHILRDLVRATFSNIEEQSLELVIYSLLPVASQVEQAMNVKLFDEEERRTHYVKFELKGLLRGDLKARTEFYNAMLDRGVFNADMVLELEDMNPQPDGLGKVYVMPLNMVNKEMVVSPQPLTIENKDSAMVKRATVQVVQRRSAALRRRLTIAYKPKFEEFAAKLVKKEVEAVRTAVEQMLSRHGISEFNSWLQGFYRDFGIEVDALIAPLVTSYATAILPVAQEEISNESEISPQYADFQREYREYFAKRHIISSREQLEAVIRNAQKEAADERDALEQRLNEWEEKRAAKIVMRETVRSESAFTRSAFALCGIMKIRSVAYGESCPYCQALDGKVIGIDEYFLSKGDFLPEGAERPLTVSNNCSHPPYHDGCDCGIEAAI